MATLTIRSNLLEMLRAQNSVVSSRPLEPIYLAYLEPRAPQPVTPLLLPTPTQALMAASLYSGSRSLIVLDSTDE